MEESFADEVGQSEEYPLQAVVAHFGGGPIAVHCGGIGDSDQVQADHAVITAIKLATVQ